MTNFPSVLAVLVIDDNAAWARGVMNLIEKSLPESNRKVRWEATITAGQKAAEDFHPDFVWLDLDLPDSRPLETLEVVSRFPEPVWIFSDHFQDGNPERDEMAMACFKVGARPYRKDLGTIEYLVKEMAKTHLIRIYRANGRGQERV